MASEFRATATRFPHLGLLPTAKIRVETEGMEFRRLVFADRTVSRGTIDHIELRKYWQGTTYVVATIWLRDRTRYPLRIAMITGEALRRSVEAVDFVVSGSDDGKRLGLVWRAESAAQVRPEGD